MRGYRRSLASLAALLLLNACVRVLPEPTAPAPAAPATALEAGLAPGPKLKIRDLTPQRAAAALASFVASCPKLLARDDRSGLTRAADWRRPCMIASRLPEQRAAGFFRDEFETVRVGSGQAYVTGYFEPELEASRTRGGKFQIPVYRLPSHLVRDWPDAVPPAQRTGPPPASRRDEAGRLVPYFDRAEIEAGALVGEALEIAWLVDSVDMYFLQVQGSGRLRTADGGIIRIGYAGSNGHPYTSIGALMRERGLIGSGPGQYPGSMQGIGQYLRDNPAAGQQLMRENRRWIFFRELTGEGPVGALGVSLQERTAVAADPAFVTLGAPVWLALDDERASGLWIAQDTGSAITGANRFDSFWGAGEDAARIAGGMSAHGEALVLLPRDTLARLGVR